MNDVWSPAEINGRLRESLTQSETAKVSNLGGQNSVAVSLPEKTSVEFDGIAGDHFGGLYEAAKITMKGDVGRFLANGMTGGEITVIGNTGTEAGHQLNDGVLAIHGQVSGNAASFVNGGMFLISGGVSGDLGTGMTGGTVVVIGNIGGDVGKMMSGGEIYISGKITETDDMKISEINQNDLKDVKKLFREQEINTSGLDFRKIEAGQIIEEPPIKFDEPIGLSGSLVLIPATIEKKPGIDGLDDVDISMKIGGKVSKSLKMNLPFLWNGEEGPKISTWKIGDSAPKDMNKANLIIIDLVPNKMARRFDLESGEDLRLLVELVREGSHGNAPVMIRISGGNIGSEMKIIEKSNSDGVVIMENSIPIEADISSIRKYKNVPILIERKEVSAKEAMKYLALGASGIYITKDCKQKTMNELSKEIKRMMNAIGVQNIANLGIDSLKSLDYETSALPGVTLAGYDSIIPMWK